MVLCEQRREAERNQQEKGTLGLLKGAGPGCPGPADFFPKELWDGGPFEQYKLGENWLIQESLACSSGIDSRESCSLGKVKREAEMEVDSMPIIPASSKYCGYQGGPQSLGQLEDLS